ncbi:MAG: histone deacetylase family protein [Ardenticatenaceae bacterium]|nr:histone deacetylase family protein [Anaerolineales bacterium]MCB8922114.1 histone deacetylase family protein [Ardenticatenaceae bacterium]MCB9003230.1 histone deacetylase family protein [Ardenticatenaceae bacterium]
MHTFYDAGHNRHDPGQLPQANSPDNDLSLEVPRRATVLYEAIKAAAFGPIIAPGDFGIEPIGDVHDYGMLNLLQHGYRLWQEEKTSLPLIPHTYSVRPQSNRIPRSLWGMVGYYCFDSSTPILAHTWDVAYWSAQTAVSAAALAYAGSQKVTYALCRPPGHHAASNMYGGYCYLNNAAITANWLVQQGQRVAIVDVDYHHGNGTQEIFYGRSDVLYCSLHADPFNEYPFFWGHGDEYGDGPGRSYNFNYPLPRHTDEALYLRTLDEALSKVRLFVPDILVISLGLDIIAGDPAGSFQLTVDTLPKIGARIGAFNLPMVIIQEGGYNIPALGEQIVAFFNGLLGK